MLYPFINIYKKINLIFLYILINIKGEIKLKKTKVLVPNYYNQFQCIGNKCEDHCCKGWKITIDKDTYMKYKKVKNIDFKDKLQESIGRNRQTKSNYDYGKMKLINNNCSLLSEEGLCEVYLNLGEENMCYTCKTYPRTYNKVDDILEKSLTLSCIEAARKILLNKEIMEFNLDIEEVDDINIVKEVKSNLTKNNNEKYFNELRIFCISLIQDRRFSIEERLAILGLLFNNINNNQNEENIILDSVETYTKNIESGVYNNILEKFDLESKSEAQLEFLTNTFNELMSNKNITNERYLNNLNRVIEGLMLNGSTTEEIKDNFKEVIDKYYKPYIENKEYIYENYLVNYMFSNLFPIGEKSLMDAYLSLIVQFAVIKMNIIGIAGYYKEDFNDKNIVDIIQGFTMTLGHDKFLISKIKKYLIDNNMNTVAHMIILTGK